MSLQGPPHRRRPRDYTQSSPRWRLPKLRWESSPLVLTAVVLAVVVAAIALVGLRVLEPTGSEVALPSFEGMPLDAARRQAAALHVELRVVSHHPDSHAAKDVVLGQFPAAGEHVRQGRTVDVIASDGPMLVAVPNLVGMSLRDARVALGNAHLELGTVTEQRTNELTQGRILDQRPDASTQIAEGRAVDVSVAQGRAETYTPNFVGLSLAFAQTAARGIGVSLAAPLWLPIAKNAKPKGTVVAQDPLPGQALGSSDKIVLSVSGGPPPTPTPLPTLPPTEAPVTSAPPPPSVAPSSEINATPTAAPAARSMRIGVKLPSFPSPRHVRVALVDAAGSRDLYDDTTAGGFTLSFDVTVTGSGMVQTYVDGTLITSTPL